MKAEPGLTAFWSNVQTYDLMTKEEKNIANHSWVEYGPHPYMRIKDCSGRTNGLGLESEGKEKDITELGEYDSMKLKRYPMVGFPFPRRSSTNPHVISYLTKV